MYQDNSVGTNLRLLAELCCLSRSHLFHILVPAGRKLFIAQAKVRAYEHTQMKTDLLACARQAVWLTARWGKAANAPPRGTFLEQAGARE